MNVEPFPHELGRYYVQSTTRPDMKHTVDLAYVAEGQRKPRPACSCERGLIYAEMCKHILAVVLFESKRLGLPGLVKEQNERIIPS